MDQGNQGGPPVWGGNGGGPPPLIRPISRQKQDRGLALACLVSGLFAVFLSVVVVGGLMGVVGLIFGIAHLLKSKGARLLVFVGMSLSLVGIAVAGVIGVLAVGYARDYFVMFSEMAAAGSQIDAWEGVYAPPYAMTTLDGESISLEDLRGKRVVINIWATWCPPCVKEIPHFQALAMTHGDEVVVIGISDETEKTVRDFVDDTDMDYAIVVDEAPPSPFGDIRAYPTTFVIDRNGVIQHVVEGYLDESRLFAYALDEDFVGEALDEPEPPYDTIQESDAPLYPALLWELEMPVYTLAKGDWTGDGVDEILAQDWDGIVWVYDLAGEVIDEVDLSEPFHTIHLGRHPDGPRLLGHDRWGSYICIFDQHGEELWRHTNRWGVNSAWWVDLDGDGIDEMVAGMNGFGGLRAFSADGKALWRTYTLGNIWNHTGVSRPGDTGVIILTEAGGMVQYWRGDGKRQGAHRPDGGYFTSVLSGMLDEEGRYQVLAIDNKGDGYALDEEGAILWQARINANEMYAMDRVDFGDVNGDGARDWLILDSESTLSAVTTEGLRIAQMTTEEVPEFAKVITRPGEPGLVMLFVDDLLQAYVFGEDAVELVPEPMEIEGDAEGAEGEEVEGEEAEGEMTLP